jgi:hypothetical protein
VPRGALSGEDDAFGAQQFAGMFGQAAEDDAAFALFGAAAQAVLDGGGLLEDLLEHVMLVLAELVGFELVFQLADDRADSASSMVVVRKLSGWRTAISLSLR